MISKTIKIMALIVILLSICGIFTNCGEKSSDDWYNKGIALGKLGRHNEALEAYNKVIEITPGDHKAWYEKGAALNKLGRKKDAKKAFKKANEIKKKQKAPFH